MDLEEAADIDNKLNLVSGRHGKPIKEVLLSPDGQPLHEVTPEALSNSSFDWAAFERRFGLDTVTDEEINIDWEKHGKSWEGNESHHADNESPFHTPHTPDSTSEGRWTKPNKFESSHASFEFVDDDEIDLDLNDHSSTHQTNQSKPSTNIQRPKPSLFENSAMEFWRDKPSQKAPPPRKGRKQLSDPLEQHLFSTTDPLQHQPNRKRPGYERRVARMERQMEKIAEVMLCDPNSEWSKEGAEFERAMLSSNMQNLTVLYNADGSHREEKWWRKFNAKYAGMLRARMASELRTKYVPRVFFQRGWEHVSTKHELDGLFERIEMERAERVESEGGMKGRK